MEARPEAQRLGYRENRLNRVVMADIVEALVVGLGIFIGGQAIPSQMPSRSTK
jgi:hypothetical protein